MTLRRSAPRGPEFNRDQLDELVARGTPLVLRVDEVLGDDAIRGTLLVGPALGRAVDQQMIVRDAFDVARARSLRSAIKGTSYVAPLSPADVVTFEAGFEHEGVVRSGIMSARTHGKMPGGVQVMDAMVRPSDARVTSKGPFQTLTIASGADARAARDAERVLEVFDWARSQSWPGGAAGVIMRDSSRRTKEFFEERGMDRRALEEDLEEAFASGTVLEVIPAWKVRMGFEQISRDVDPTKETSGWTSGPFSRRYSLGNGSKGFIRSIVVVADEEEREFGGLTGNVVRVVSGVQPIRKGQAVAREALESRTRKSDKPLGVIKLYDDETVRLMAEERAERYPREERQPVQQRQSFARSRSDDDDEQEYRPRSPSPGAGGLRGAARPAGGRRF